MNKANLIFNLQQSEGYKSWIGKSKIMATECDDFGNIRVILVDNRKYYMLRFFKLSEHGPWQVSSEVKNSNLENITKYLLKELSKK